MYEDDCTTPTTITHKVHVKFDERQYDDLVQMFPSIDEERIYSIWNNQSSWNACYDILSSIMANGDKKYSNLEEMSSWPDLKQSAITQVKNEVDCWTICDVDSSRSRSSSGFDSDAGDDVNEDKWEVLDADGNNTTMKNIEVNDEMKVSSTSFRTYTDAVKHNCNFCFTQEDDGCSIDSGITCASLPSAVRWKPTFEVYTVLPPGRTPQTKTTLNSPSKRTICYDVYEDDDEGLWEPYDDYAAYKSSGYRARMSCMLANQALQARKLINIKGKKHLPKTVK